MSEVCTCVCMYDIHGEYRVCVCKLCYLRCEKLASKVLDDNEPACKAQDASIEGG